MFYQQEKKERVKEAKKAKEKKKEKRPEPDQEEMELQEKAEEIRKLYLAAESEIITREKQRSDQDNKRQKEIADHLADSIARTKSRMDAIDKKRIDQATNQQNKQEILQKRKEMKAKDKLNATVAMEQDGFATPLQEQSEDTREGENAEAEIDVE